MSKNILKNWKLWGVILAIVLILLVTVCILNKNKEVNSEAINRYYYYIGKEIKLTKNMKRELYKKVKNDIMDSLKTPSTAIFPEFKEWNIDVNSNNIIEISSYVDSQNSYGAMLRANFEQKYILLNKDSYLCIYKKFDDEIEFDITERAENKKIINRNMTKIEIDNFIAELGKNPYSTLYNKVIDYTFNEETQQLEMNLKITSQSYEDLKNHCYLALTAAIDECICIPTIKTTINVYFGEDNEQQKIATVKDIDFNFIIEKWNALCSIGLNSDHLTTNLEEELGEKLIQEHRIKNMKVDYWNK